MEYVVRQTAATHLDPRQPKYSCLLVLEVLEDLVGGISIDIGLLHERESDTMVERAELSDAFVSAGFLATKLERRRQ